jgi:hypothetical protein
MKDIKPEKITDSSGTGGKVITRHRFKAYAWKCRIEISTVPNPGKKHFSRLSIFRIIYRKHCMCVLCGV